MPVHTHTPPEVSARALHAMVRWLATDDPSRPPLRELIDWSQRLAVSVGAQPRLPRTLGELEEYVHLLQDMADRSRVRAA